MQRCNHCGFLNPDQTQHCQNCHKTIELTRYVKTDNKYNVPQKLTIQPGHLFLAETEKYVVEKEIGSGGFGTVYLVKNAANIQYALKLLHLWEINPEEHQEIQGRFTREYQAGRINSPFIVQSHNFGQLGGNPFIVMQYCSGGDLRQKMNINWNENDINKVATHVLQGLHHLHSSGIIHRDLKPENILFGKDTNVLLSDFGISGFLQNRSTKADWRGRVKKVFGTAVYMPPEVLDIKTSFKSVGAATDIFGFGVLMYELFTQGKLPFGDFEEFNKDKQAFFQRVKKGDFYSIRTYRQNISHNWVNIIEQCIHPDPNKRFISALEVLKHIAPYQSVSSHAFHNYPTPQIPKGTYALQVMNGDEHGRIYNITNLLQNKGNRILSIGWFDKDTPHENNIPVVENYTQHISRHHATLEFDNKQWFLRDGQWRDVNGKWAWRKSTNGTLLNSRPVKSDGELIRKDDIITLGYDTTLKVISN